MSLSSSRCAGHLNQSTAGWHAVAHLSAVPGRRPGVCASWSPPSATPRTMRSATYSSVIRPCTPVSRLRRPTVSKVPVVRHAEARGLWDLAAEILARRVSEAARTNKATREELTGSTITVTSLGKLGGIVSTPIINAPELAIIGVNKAVERPVVIGGAVAVRLMMKHFFLVRSSIRRRLRRRRHDPGAQGNARAPGHHLHSWNRST